MRNVFVFDENKCVACHACVVACSIENGTQAAVNWRTVNSYNPLNWHVLPVFHHSLACNHCDEAPCMAACPAKAYTRDAHTGAVIHHAERCIGCRYCTWVCPYDAPKFNPTEKIIEKCTFCNHRIGEGLKPACVSLCPVGALDFKTIHTDLDKQVVKGLPKTKIFPKLKIIPSRHSKAPDSVKAARIPAAEYQLLTSSIKPPEPKISLRHEWTLVLFTLLVAILNGLFAAGMVKTPLYEPIGFLVAAVGGVALSAVHLGKKMRAYRAVFHLRSSWLSREILAYSMFSFLAFIFMFVFKTQIIAWLTLFTGIFTLISVDRVYQPVLPEFVDDMEQLHTTLGGIIFFALFAKLWLLLLAALVVRHVFYFRRRQQAKSRTSFLLPVFRVVLGLIFPVLLWYFNPPAGFGLLLFSVIAGELIDRAEFYSIMKVVTPAGEMLQLFNKSVEKLA